MITLRSELLEEYRRSDPVLRLLKGVAQPSDEMYASHRWLTESLPKRLMFHLLYGDLLDPAAASVSLLDVGGGYTALTRLFVKQHRYTLLDIMAHDDHEALAGLQRSLGRDFWVNADWLDLQSGSGYDVAIANDLFPNVDQRLDLFIERYLPRCRELRLSLTYYNAPRWYRVRRTDADEIFHIMAWDGHQVKRVLEKYADRIVQPRLEILLENPPSLFPNGRQVCVLRLKGERGSACEP